MEATSNYRRGWIDYAKGLIILYVVYRHTLSGLINAGLPLANSVYLIQEASMPVFFIVSGIFIRSSLEKHGLSSFIRFKFDNLMYPYFTWATLHLTLQIVFRSYANSEKEFFYYFFLIINPRAIDQFWYLYTLFAVMVLFAVTNSKWFHYRPVPNLLLAFSLYTAAFFVSTDWLALNDTMLYYLFLFFGYLSADMLLPVKNRIFDSKWPLLLLPVLAVLHYVWYIRYGDVSKLSGLDYAGFLLFIPITVITALFVFMISNWLDRWGKLDVLRYIGSHSLYIYVMHLIVTGALRVILLKLFPDLPPAVLLLLIMAGGTLIPIGCYHLLIQVRLNFLFEPTFFKVLKPSGSKSQ